MQRRLAPRIFIYQQWRGCAIVEEITLTYGTSVTVGNDAQRGDDSAFTDGNAPLVTTADAAPALMGAATKRDRERRRARDCLAPGNSGLSPLSG